MSISREAIGADGPPWKSFTAALLPIKAERKADDAMGILKAIVQATKHADNYDLFAHQVATLWSRTAFR